MTLTNNLIKLSYVIFRSVDKLDEAGVLAKEFNLLGIHIVTARNTPNRFQNLTDILAGSFLVDILEFDIDVGLGLHVGQSAGYR
jgi:hypothetical protein